MPTTETDKSQKTSIKPAEIANRIWLAGIGAYGRAYDEARDGVAKLNKDGTSFFEELVQRGEALEGDVRGVLESNQYTKRATERVDQALENGRTFREESVANINSRMDKMRNLLGLSSGNTGALTKLEAKIDVLMEEIATLRNKDASELYAQAEARAEEAISEMEDLELIEGIGAKTAALLQEAGIPTISALASLSSKDAVQLFTRLELVARAKREQWWEQAKSFASA